MKDYDYPVVMGCPFGHIGTDNRALVFGIDTALNVASDGTANLSFHL